MTHTLKILTLMLISAVLLAQEPDPFGEGKAEPKSAPAPKKKAEPVKVETDPVVIAILESKPSTPIDVMQAAINLANYGRPDEARRFMQGLINGGLTDATHWMLQRHFGTAPFVRFSIQENLQPQGKRLGDLVLTGANKFVRDPARIDSLIKQLSDPKLELRQAALVDLAEAREEAAVALVLVLGDSSRSAEWKTIQAALRRLGPVAIGPLQGALEVADTQMRANAVTVLGSLRTREVVPFLLRPFLTAPRGSAEQRAAEEALSQTLGGLPSKSDAERFLYREITSYLEGRLPGKADHQDLIELWRWDDTQKRPVREMFDTVAAPLRFASRLGAELTSIAPEKREYWQLRLVAGLESAKFAAGWNQPLPTGAGSVSDLAISHLDVIEDVLQLALERGHVAAAVGALEVIGRSGDETFLQSTGGQPRATAKALRNPNRRVRFAAMQAIFELGPQRAYAGASYLPETLAFFAQTSGNRQFLLAHPRTELSQTLVGLFLEMGLEAAVTTGGAEAFQAAMRNSDFEFVLLSDAIDHPGLQEQIQQFRRESVTATIPIGVLAHDENFDRLKRLLADDPLTEVFAQPSDAAGASFVIRRLLGRTGRDLVTPDERIYQAQMALEHWAVLSENPEVFGFYELLPHQNAAEAALTVPALTVKAARVLGLLASPRCQQSLVNLANQNGRPLHERQAAAQAFDVAVKRRGILLTQAEILHQYDVYNQSANADPDTQQVLGAILDSIEAPSKNAVAATAQN